MTCTMCENLPIKQVSNIDRHLVQGKKSLMAIADHYAVDIGDLRTHMVVCLQNKTEPNEDEELLGSQRQLQAIITQFQQDMAEGKHMEFDPETGIDGRGTVSNLLSAMREHRETILTRSKIRTADEIYQGLQQNVVGPLINALTAIMIEEGRKTREEIFDITRKHSELHPKIKQSVDTMLERAADRMSTEAIHEIPERVKALVGAKKTGTGRPSPKH